jgi:hypothetical protein
VIVGDLDLERIVATPYEANSVLIVDPDTALSLTIAAKFLQAIAGRALQIVERRGTVQHREFPFRGARWRSPARPAGSPDFRRPLVGESLDHWAIVTHPVNNVKRY